MRRGARLCFRTSAIRNLGFGTKLNSSGRNDCLEIVERSTSPGSLKNNAPLPAVNLALRIVNPCQEFPATAVGVELLAEPSDPCVTWREYYSFEDGRPYYHNLQTNVTTFKVPSGLITKFPLLHRRQGLFVDAENRVYNKAVGESSGGGSDKGNGGASDGQGGGDSVSPPGGAGSGNGSLTIKQKLTAYGGGGLLLYLIIHNLILAGIFISLYFLHIDLVGIVKSYGLTFGGAQLDSVQADSQALSKKKNPSVLATLGISILLNKLLVPLELALTLMAAPVLVPRLKPLAAKIIPRVKSFINKYKNKYKNK